MKQRLFLFSMIFTMALFSLQACNGSDPAPVDFRELIEKIPDTPIASPGDLGELTDLGDLVEPAGDHWYFTRANAINDDGIVIRESNYDGVTTRGAFRWSPDTTEMTFLGIHSGTYDDHYNIDYEGADPRGYFAFSEAVDINKSGAIIGNSTTGAEGEKRAFRWVNGVFVDLPPDAYIVEENDCLRRVIGCYSEAVDINDRGEIVLTLEDRPGRKARLLLGWLESHHCLVGFSLPRSCANNSCHRTCLCSRRAYRGCRFGSGCHQRKPPRCCQLRRDSGLLRSQSRSQCRRVAEPSSRSRWKGYQGRWPSRQGAVCSIRSQTGFLWVLRASGKCVTMTSTRRA